MKPLYFLILLLGSTAILFAQAEGAYINEMTGTVEIKLPGSTDWLPAQKGNYISVSTIISTGFKSTAFLLIGNSTVTVYPLTRLSLEEILNLNNDEKVRLNLRTGRIRANVTPPMGGETEFTVSAPIVTASVRGTVFDFDTRNLRVAEGSVVLVPRLRTVRVSAGQSSWASDSGGVMNPLTAAETNRALPDLPGQSSTPSAGDEAKPAPPQGSLVVKVLLESQ
jgi:hypothetical protein